MKVNMIKDYDGTFFSKFYYYTDKEGNIRVKDTGKVVGLSGSYYGPTRSYLEDTVEDLLLNVEEQHLAVKKILGELK